MAARNPPTSAGAQPWSQLPSCTVKLRDPRRRIPRRGRGGHSLYLYVRGPLIPAAFTSVEERRIAAPKEHGIVDGQVDASVDRRGKFADVQVAFEIDELR